MTAIVQLETLNADEAARLLGMSAPNLSSRIVAGTLKVERYKEGHGYRYLLSSVEKAAEAERRRKAGRKRARLHVVPPMPTSRDLDGLADELDALAGMAAEMAAKVRAAGVPA